VAAKDNISNPLAERLAGFFCFALGWKLAPTLLAYSS
jgi:hypothetical protein